MLTTLRKLIRLNLDDLWLCCGVVVGLFLLFQIGTGCVMFFAKPDTSVMISGIVLPIAAGFMGLIVTLGHVGLSFVQALQFGQTRRRAMGLMLGISCFETLCATVLAALLTWLERLAAPALWLALTGRQQIIYDLGGVSSPVPEGGLSAAQEAYRAATLFVEPFCLDWWWFLLIPLGCVAGGLIIGAVMQRFGGRGGWILWCVWMAACFSPQFLPWQKIGSIPWLYPVMGITAAAALIWSVWSLLHAVVKS